jgi:hypothetical protein
MILMQRENRWLKSKWYPIEVWPDSLDAVKQRIWDLEHDPIYMSERELEFRIERVVKRG